MLRCPAGSMVGIAIKAAAGQVSYAPISMLIAHPQAAR